ncbi:MAG: heterodisulfide reductase-related iron-sulfur binding cluster [Methylococcales bacterium]|nr:heterodisulfide reductase-related iron-sulfur binding cluster [Methylococcales bacterium]
MFDFMDMDFNGQTEDVAAGGGPYIPEARDCLNCGMCVGGCPTFRLFQIEAETPRRRIRILSKLLVENQPITAEEQRHLQNCLQCRACEVICPSHMTYGQLYDQAQSKLQNQPRRLARLAFWLIANKRWLAGIMPLLLAYLKSGLQKRLRKSGLLHKTGLAQAEALLSEPSIRPLANSYPPKAGCCGRVALFTGCLAEHFDRATLSDSIRLLNAIGFEVLVPPEQGCCGAIHQHNGQSATTLINNNIQVFNALEVDAVLHTASGCGAMLSEYQSDDVEAALRFRLNQKDISQFLLEHWPADLQLLPASIHIAVHEPCSQRNVLKSQQNVYSLLQKIPQVSVAALADNQLCCGAGGSYMLSHPENAAQLKALKQQVISAAQADYIVSSNYGCAAYLSSEQHKLIHPLTLLAKQLPSG